MRICYCTGLIIHTEQHIGFYQHQVAADQERLKTTGKLLQVPVGKGMLGRVVDTLGRPIDGKGPIDSKTAYPVEKIAPGVPCSRRRQIGRAA